MNRHPPGEKVAITRCGDYRRELVDDAVATALDLVGGMDKVVKPGDRVLLKVNLLAPAAPDAAVTTHPAVVRSVAAQVLECGGVPVVADAPGYLFAGGKSRALAKSGIADAVAPLGVEALQFESVEKPFVSTPVPGGVHLRQVMAARLALEADVIITLPKLKTHSNTWYTGAVKNMFGAVATATRKQAHALGDHQRFAAAIVDIYSVMKPRLAVMDAVVGMEGDGPRHGDPRHTGLILAARDPVALDAVASRLIGFQPQEILTVRNASERGLGEGRLERITLPDERVEDVAVDYRKPGGRQVNIHPLLMRLVGRLVKVEPRLERDACTRCRICEQSCPVGAISMDPYPEIDRSACILCFCCNEMCPEGAMTVWKSRLARRLDR